MPGTTRRGVVHGKTIELEEETGLPDGQSVTVLLQPVSRQAPGEGLRRAFGAWAEDAEDLDEYVAWSRKQRKVGRGSDDS